MAKRSGNVDLEDFHTYDLASELTERMEMARQDAQKFIHNVMTRAGFRTEQTRDSYVQGSEDDERGSGRSRYRRNGSRDDGGFSD